MDTVTEDQLLRAVLELAALLGYLCYHARPARTANGWRTAGQGNGANGFPDLVLARSPRLIFAELKAERGRLRPEQEAWMEALNVPGVVRAVWYPRDWASGEIERELRSTVSLAPTTETAAAVDSRKEPA